MLYIQNVAVIEDAQVFSWNEVFSQKRTCLRVSTITQQNQGDVAQDHFDSPVLHISYNLLVVVYYDGYPFATNRLQQYHLDT